MDFYLKSAAELSRGVKDGAWTAREVVVGHLDRIQKWDPQINSFLHLDEEGALSQAEKIDKDKASGRALGALAGVPVGIKDSLVVKGLPSTAGSKILEGWVSPYDATAVTKLKSADAIVLGKLNMDEFAMGSSNENSAYGPCHNPWDLQRVPGGSSGGSAAAVAAGFCPIALGSDTGGSIRQPAALCGVLGIKPTYGSVSRYGLIAYASSLDQVGPLARHVEDLHTTCALLAGKDPMDATSLEASGSFDFGTLSENIKGLRIGICKELAIEKASDAVAASVQRGLDVLTKAGARLVDIKLPHVKYSLPTYYLIAPAEASSNLARFDGIHYGNRESHETLGECFSNTRGKLFGEEVKRRIMMGTFALKSGYVDAYYNKATKIRHLITREFEEAFKSCDVIASPTTPTTAFKLGEKSTPEEMYQADVFTLACNLAGLPGISVPCPLSNEGLPVGMQLMAPRFQEKSLLKAAWNVEQTFFDPQNVPAGLL